MIKIHPLFIMTAPMLVLISCAQYDSGDQPARPATAPASGRTLFLRNCAHCHGADAHGDEGPDLHSLDWTDQQIASRIRRGKAGQMTAFAGKLPPSEIDSLVSYVNSLR
jgi:mono/diheme cytochrome c family protein